MPLQAADEHLLSDRDTTRGFLGPDAGAGDEACDGGVPRFGLAGSQTAGVVEAEGMERPFAAGAYGCATNVTREREGQERNWEGQRRNGGKLAKSKTH